jgi:predicted phosphoadenosine phosphosulfate sulfurtransferase
LNGIPDEVTKQLQDTGRVPSYKAIAIAILSNDHQLSALGFSQQESILVRQLIEEKKKKDSIQLSLF